MVNGEIKPISFIPTTGDIIEIKIFKNKYSANRHWLEFLHTPSAKSQLNRFLKTQKKEELITKAEELLNKKLKEFKLPTLNSENDRIKTKYKNNELEKMFLEILDKKQNYSQLIKSVYPKERKSHLDSIPKSAKNKPKCKKNKLVIVDRDKMIDYSLCLECKPTFPHKIIARTGKD
jgi:(p)ppGpp synthase/HD superfamily hydrolase